MDEALTQTTLSEDAYRLATKFYGTPLPWCDMVSSFEEALQSAFNVGAEAMREDAAALCDKFVGDMQQQKMDALRVTNPIEFICDAAEDIQEAIRALKIPTYETKK